MAHDWDLIAFDYCLIGAWLGFIGRPIGRDWTLDRTWSKASSSFLRVARTQLTRWGLLALAQECGRRGPADSASAHGTNLARYMSIIS